MLKKIANGNKFDFDIGHLSKSPCKECDLKSHLPGCSKACQKLKQLQTLLSGCVSCSNGYHHTDPYIVFYRSHWDFTIKWKMPKSASSVLHGWWKGSWDRKCWFRTILLWRRSYNALNLVRFAHKWNNGTMEWWNIGTIEVPSGWKIIRFMG